ncbi:MAG: hypothetical protein COA79_21535 [Planctomycetota bacterium]|nr:MAG: hypothetical protein COA79_21535 [Planctomycetota bacterium]
MAILSRDDLFNREVVGCQLSPKIDSALIIKAFENAVVKQGIRLGHHNIMLHSDKGSQYASNSFREVLANYGVTHPCLERVTAGIIELKLACPRIYYLGYILGSMLDYILV